MNTKNVVQIIGVVNILTFIPVVLRAVFFYFDRGHIRKDTFDK